MITINSNLRNQLNLMGYSNTVIDLLPKSEIEKIVKGAITKEAYASRTMTGALFNESGKIFTKVGDPVVISAIKEGGVVKEVLDKEINNLDDMVKDKNIDDLKNSLFNTKIC